MQADRLRDEEGRLAALRRYDLSDTLDRGPTQNVVDLLQDVLQVPGAAITLLDAETEWLRALRGADLASIPRRHGFCEETIRQYGAISVPDARDDGRFAASPLVAGAPNIRAYVGAPLSTPEGYNIGALWAFDVQPRQFSERELRLVEKLARLVIEYLELRQIARQDPMTGALTRGGFLAEVEKDFQRSVRYDRPSALVMIDVDNFRAINDRYGHPAGDAVLVSIAAACMGTMRRSDVFGRVGGGEFGLLLPETEPEEAAGAAERIRRIVEETIVEAGGDASIKATISLGVAPIPPAAEGAAAWISEADIALYEAKQFGRNRVVLAKARRPARRAISPEGPERRVH
ncbi:MAG TPA: sensor domain-containing diguanylate cyclase [Devosia sp.]|nr:sensor domain-containing diguanylate cyclase [Devosia sp.]